MKKIIEFFMFENLISVALIRVMYPIGILISIIFLGMLISDLWAYLNMWFIWKVLFKTFGYLLLINIGWRLFCELIALLFAIYGSLVLLNEKTVAPTPPDFRVPRPEHLNYPRDECVEREPLSHVIEPQGYMESEPQYQPRERLATEAEEEIESRIIGGTTSSA